ncbi:uncharacterized protein LOC126838053 [Adelges cooleyi]|uniref:uncharacterized protein LOC126838053 n=1 Tax=Adelges cooleyi TaxID=133065 RepID=UPI0021803E27|nr:uncharacterized protein LOC126838053 [Adelges cooleyi]
MMILRIIVITTFVIKVQCGTYGFNSIGSVKSPHLIHQTHHDASSATINYDSKIPSSSNQNVEYICEHSPIILSERAPVTINYKSKPKGVHPGHAYISRHSSPIILTSTGIVTVNFDYKDADPTASVADQTDRKPVCILAKVMVEMPSGIIMSYLKFKTISCYLPEDLKSDVAVLVDNKKMPYKEFEQTLRVHGCNDMEDSETCSCLNDDYITLSDGTEVNLDVYRQILTSITNGSETLMIPNVFNGPYSTYAPLLEKKLLELAESAIVITSSGYRVPFSLYYAVDQENFQRSSNDQEIKQVTWHDGKTIRVQTIRDIVNSLKNPESIYFVFPNRKRLPFIPRGKEENMDFLNVDPNKIHVDIGRQRYVPLSVFNDIVAAVHISDGNNKGMYDTVITNFTSSSENRTPSISEYRIENEIGHSLTKQKNIPKELIDTITEKQLSNSTDVDQTVQLQFETSPIVIYIKNYATR